MSAATFSRRFVKWVVLTVLWYVAILHLTGDWLALIASLVGAMLLVDGLEWLWLRWHAPGKKAKQGQPCI